MTREFYEKLNTAELEYTKAGQGGGAIALINLFAALGSNICALATDNDTNQELIGVARDGAFDEWSRLEFYRLIAGVKHGFSG
jgi:hypothetical protein